MLRRPPPLATGSHVRVLSPSGPVTPEIVSYGAGILESWGLRVTFDERAFERHRYLAGDDAARAAALNDALRDDDVDAIVFSRGGYGAMRILDRIDWAALRDRPRPLVGFSDITAIHLAALRHANVATLHAPVVKSFSSQEADIESLRRALFGEPREIEIPVQGLAAGRARGPMVGGNLSLVVAMLASRHLPDLEGAVLFVEDVTEEDYRLDRLFTALHASHSFEKLAALVVGEFHECGGTYVTEHEIRGFVEELTAELGTRAGIPVVSGFPSGHGSRNLPFAHGATVEVDAERGVVTLLEDLTEAHQLF